MDNKEEFTPSWIAFILFGSFSIFCFIAGGSWFLIWFGGPMFAIYAALSFPSPHLQKKIKSFLKNFTVGSVKTLWFLIKASTIIAIVWFLFSKVGSLGKYEGQTAKEWFEDYDTLARCVEYYDAMSVTEKLSTSVSSECL